MREFKNSKAQELFLQSLRLDEIADKEAEKEIAQIGYTLGEKGHSGSITMHVEATGLRCLADDIENGLIEDDEIEL